MDRIKRAAAILLFLLILLPLCPVSANEEEAEAPAPVTIAGNAASGDQEAETAPVSAGRGIDADLCRQIRDTYAAARKMARRSSFKGYCGAYVADQLVALGINSSRLSANGNRTYDLYRNMDRTSGGYSVTAYGAGDYSLSQALSAIMAKDASARNILVGFEKSTSKAGKKYGHALFIHGIRDGNVYFSDSCARTIDGVKYPEGEPIVCPLDSFLHQYADCKLDGVVHFQKTESAPPAKPVQSLIMEEMAAPSSENEFTLG